MTKKSEDSSVATNDHGDVNRGPVALDQQDRTQYSQEHDANSLNANDAGRMRSELDEVNARRRRLSDFLNGSTYPTLPIEERELIGRQYQAMSDYAQALDQRLAIKR